MKGIIEEYGMFIVAAMIGLVMFLLMYGFTVDNDDYDKTIDEKLFTVSAGDNGDIRSRGRPIINVTNAAIRLGDQTFKPKDCITSAVDADGKNLKNQVKIKGEVNVNRIGQYPVTFTVTDSYGLKTSETVYFIVSPYGTPTYNITVGEYLTTDQSIAIEGATVHITYTAFPGQYCTKFTLIDSSGKAVPYIGTIEGLTEGTISFSMGTKDVNASVETAEIEEE